MPISISVGGMEYSVQLISEPIERVPRSMSS